MMIVPLGSVTMYGILEFLCACMKVRLNKISCFAGSADHDDVLVPCVLPVLRAAVHGKELRLCQDHVVFEDRIDKGGRCPSRFPIWQSRIPHPVEIFWRFSPCTIQKL